MSISKYSTEINVISGQKLSESIPVFPNEEGVTISVPNVKDETVKFTSSILSKHVLALGSIGSGKTNMIFHMIASAMSQLGPNDRMLLFDAKGDYEQEFSRSGDVVIGNVMGTNTEKWNLFADIMDSPSSEPNSELLRQIAATLFKKQIDSSNNPTFPSGARDLFIGLTTAFVRREQKAGRASWHYINNMTLKKFFLSEVSDPEKIDQIIAPYHDLAWLHMYILAPKSATTQSYLAPLLAVVNEMFVGCFAEEGDFSVRRYIANGQGKLFIEYDAEYGCTMDSMYTVLLDLAMRHSIGRTARNGGSIFFILDELPILPALTYLDQIINFGRSLGIKVIAGMQNTSQMEDKYGTNKAVSIMSGFSSFLCFHLFDEKSRDIIKQRHGKNLRCITSLKPNGKDDLGQLQELSVIEDWDITDLRDGRCIISLPAGEPFIFHPRLYRKTNHSLPSGTDARPRKITIKGVNTNKIMLHTDVIY